MKYELESWMGAQKYFSRLKTRFDVSSFCLPALELLTEKAMHYRSLNIKIDPEIYIYNVLCDCCNSQSYCLNLKGNDMKY